MPSVGEFKTTCCTFSSPGFIDTNIVTILIHSPLCCAISCKGPNVHALSVKVHTLFKIVHAVFVIVEVHVFSKPG